jgi:hypothetical protein
MRIRAPVIRRAVGATIAFFGGCWARNLRIEGNGHKLLKLAYFGLESTGGGVAKKRIWRGLEAKRGMWVDSRYAKQTKSAPARSAIQSFASAGGAGG